ncbi:signal peptidase II [Patescibacteria group bacterium]|nr:signal peptidase II [Patescibacteria group bacterium]
MRSIMDWVFRKKLLWFFFSGGLVLISDQLSKILIRLHGGFYICNPYIAFGLKIPEFLFWIFWCGIIFSLFYFLHKKCALFDTFCLTLILSGALSNLIDRLWIGCIIDFIQLGFGPIFNPADFFISLGVIMLITAHIKIKR